ncbi:MAG: response regulator [Pirellulales bacterium]|nr:response regulator [Pirellulales bacterium]
MTNPAQPVTNGEPNPFAGCSLLVVDDNEILRERMARAMASRGLRVRAAANYDEALELARAQTPDLAVVDLRMPGPSGLELLRDLLQLRSDMKVVVLTGFGSIATAVEAMRLGAANYLPKPADADEVLAAFKAEHGEGASASQMPDDYQAPSLARAEWEHIQRVLADCGNNISEAARRLGIHRRSLQRKLHKLAPD